MDIPNDLFPQEILNIIEEIAESHFLAFDLEFSGISRARGRKGKPTLQEHYEEVKSAAEQYQILQVGLTIVKEDIEKGVYTLRPYNFNISPLPTLHERLFTRTWSFNSGAISFLLRNQFQFDLPLTKGIPYLSRKEENQARSAIVQEEETRTNISELGLKKDDEVLVEYIRTSIKNWQVVPPEKRESYLNISGKGAEASIPKTLNRYQIWLTHQVIRSEYPRLQSQGMGHFVQITALAEGSQERERERKLSHAIGFRWLIEAIITGNIDGIPMEYFPADRFGSAENDENLGQRKVFLDDLKNKLRRRRRVLIGHNCFMDLVYLYDCFIGDLPKSVEVFQDEVHELFPAIVDTKYLAPFGLGRWGQTSLEELDVELRTEAVPRIEVPAEFARYQHTDIFHEAGYDSFVTAKVAIKLSTKMERESKHLEKRSKLPSIPQTLNQIPSFGIQEDGYVSASESIAEGEEAITSTRRSSKVFSNSVTAVKKLFGKMTLKQTEGDSRDEERPEAFEIGDRQATQLSTQPISETVFSSKPQTKWLTKSLDKSGRDISKTSLKKIGLPELNHKDTNESRSDTVRAESSKTSNEMMNYPLEPNELIGKSIPEQTLSDRRLMPSWDGDSAFWHVFGNTLQVNGSKEGFWRLIE